MVEMLVDLHSAEGADRAAKEVSDILPEPQSSLFRARSYAFMVSCLVHGFPGLWSFSY